jgi:hypothetical protein
MRKIPLKNGNFALIDDEDFELVSRWKWRVHTKGYATCTGNRLMHRIIMRAQQGQQIDHINLDKLDNRKSNLRLCTNSQNHMNIKKYKGKTSKYKGVYLDKSRGKWAADIKLNKKKIRLGRFPTEDSAGLASNVAAMKYFGPFALLNEVPNV